MLKNLTFIALVLSFSLSLFAESENRIEAHKHAIKELSKLHFFRNGRGMVISPDTIDVFTYLGKVLDLPGTQNLSQKTGVSSFKDRWGLQVENDKIVGFHHKKYNKMDIGVMGCAVCHSGKAAGQYIIGLGNKNIDIGQLASDVRKGTKIWKALTFWKPRSNEYKLLENDALAFATRLSNHKYNNLTQGLVPISMIQWWFYLQQGEKLPESNHRGAVKVPHFWGYGKKRFVGQFTDGFGDGSLAGWGLAVELAATQSVENVRAQIEKIEHAEDLLHDILPPPYPFKIDQAKAKLGKISFDKTCSKCHGTYERDKNELPIFKEPKHIPIHVVKTDDDRLKSVHDEFKRKVDLGPLNDYMKYTNLKKGFFAPRLEGIWSRFPYIHNASIPSIKALLTHPDLRPEVWSLKDAGEKYRFNESTMGLTLPKDSKEKLKLLKMAKQGQRNIYWTKRQGQSSKGHWFKSFEKLSKEDIQNIIEYLKTI